MLISFTPNGVTNLVDFTKYFSFLMRMLLVFGIAMEIPLFVLLLNLAGVVSGQQIGRGRPWIVIGTMVFAAVATPSTDPFSMLMLAIPMLILFALSEIAARILDRIRGRGPIGRTAPSSGRTTRPPRCDATGHAEPPSYDEVDPFDLPAWLGEREVTWTAERPAHRRSPGGGTLTADGRRPAAVRPAGHRRRVPDAGRLRRGPGPGAPGLAVRRGAPVARRRPGRARRARLPAGRRDRPHRRRPPGPGGRRRPGLVRRTLRVAGRPLSRACRGQSAAGPMLRFGTSRSGAR